MKTVTLIIGLVCFQNLAIAQTDLTGKIQHLKLVGTFPTLYADAPQETSSANNLQFSGNETSDNLSLYGSAVTAVSANSKKSLASAYNPSRKNKILKPIAEFKTTNAATLLQNPLQ